MARPPVASYPAFYEPYVSRVDTDAVQEAVGRYGPDILKFWRNIPVEKETYRYAAGKWSIKEVLQHLIDAERVFAYRIICFARKDATELPGFDENLYAANSKADSRSWDDLLAEFEATRNSTNLLVLSLDEEQLQQTGIANGNLITVNALCYIVFGHVLHHINVVQERYLSTGI